MDNYLPIDWRLNLAGHDGAPLVVVGQHAGHKSSSRHGGTEPVNDQVINVFKDIKKRIKQNRK